MATTKNALAGKSITLTFHEGVKASEIQATLEKIYKESGCLACGLVGFDLRFDVVSNPPLFERFADIRAVRNVVVQPRDIGNVNIPGKIGG
jgi:hypothetical protein